MIMKWFKKIMKKGGKKSGTENETAKKFMEASSLEEFKEMYIKFHRQELALENDFSYFDVTRSNVDGTFIGEKFDNAIRVKFLHEHNKQFLEQVNEEELMSQVRQEVEEDLQRYRAERPSNGDN